MGGFGKILDLDREVIEVARKSASRIADDVLLFVRDRTTTSIERATLRLYGVDGADNEGVPHVNRIIDAILKEGLLGNGASRYFIAEMIARDLNPAKCGEKIAMEGFAPEKSLKKIDRERIEQIGREIASEAIAKIEAVAKRRAELIDELGESSPPLIYVIVASGNIFEDVVQAKVCARAGADIIAVIRSTGQSLLDYVPEGTTTEGFGGTYATRANFKVMREALDATGAELRRYLRLCNYASGLCMPEIAALGAIERLDVMLNDALYGVLFRDINMQRTLTDQAFSRMISALGGIIINTGEDNYLTTADAFDAAHTVLASQFINEQFALKTGLKPWQIGLGHAMEMNPYLENMLAYEIAQALMTREIFPEYPLKYMPPTKFMTGNIFRGIVQDAIFNLVGMISRQGILLLGMMTEAMHTPHIHDRTIAIENAMMLKKMTGMLGSEIAFKPDGIVIKRARTVLKDAMKMLEEIAEIGLFSAIEKGMFAEVKRKFDGGRGLAGVVKKSPDYYNPLEEALKKKLKIA